MSQAIKCSKNNPCQGYKNELQEKLKDCKDWETKRKGYIRSRFPFHNEEENKVKSEIGECNIYFSFCHILLYTDVNKLIT